MLHTASWRERRGPAIAKLAFTFAQDDLSPDCKSGYHNGSAFIVCIMMAEVMSWWQYAANCSSVIFHQIDKYRPPEAVIQRQTCPNSQGHFCLYE